MSARTRRAATAAATQRSQRAAKVASNRNILDRVGPSKNLRKVLVKNIGPSVTAVDVRSLFATVGAITKVSANLGASSRHAGVNCTVVKFSSACCSRECSRRASCAS